jgi:hypothetical protein
MWRGESYKYSLPQKLSHFRTLLERANHVSHIKQSILVFSMSFVCYCYTFSLILDRKVVGRHDDVKLIMNSTSIVHEACLKITK